MTDKSANEAALNAPASSERSTWSKSKKKRMRKKHSKLNQHETEHVPNRHAQNADADKNVKSKKRPRGNQTSVDKEPSEIGTPEKKKRKRKRGKKTLPKDTTLSSSNDKTTIATGSEKVTIEKDSTDEETTSKQQFLSSPKDANEKKPNPLVGNTSPPVTTPTNMSSLQKSFLERLTGSRFRELNEELYTTNSKEAFHRFSENPDLFRQYHQGFRKQAKDWPVNPVDVIYRKIVSSRRSDENSEQAKSQEKMRKKVVVADFGCGDAKLAERLLAFRTKCDAQIEDGKAVQKKGKKSKGKGVGKEWCPFEVHSFDLVSGGNSNVTPADMCNVPLKKEYLDVGVYCLALMGSNVADFVREAWRVLKFGGVLRIAEVRSRFETASNEEVDSKKKRPLGNKKGSRSAIDDDDSPKPLMLIDEFMSLMKRCGFKCTDTDRSNKMFLFMDFVKVSGSKGLHGKEKFSAKPCIYKRR